MAESTAPAPETTPVGGEGNPGVQYPGTPSGKPNGGEAAMSHGLIDAEVPGFFTTEYDRSVVKYGWASTPINTITRKIGFRVTKSLRYGYWSLGMRDGITKLTQSITIDSDYNTNRDEPAEVTIHVEKPTALDPTDQITFRGVDGINEKGERIAYLPCNARVLSIDRSAKTATVIFLNVKEGITIDANTTIVVLGHALAEGDARVTPHAASPVPTYQYMQKFMTSASVTNEYLEATKEANYGMADLVEMNNQQFVEDIEKSYIFGIRSCTADAQTHYMTYTCAGIIQQMLEGGAHKIIIQKKGLTEATLQKTLAEIFIGNTGSTQRYLFDGMEFYTSLFDLKGVARELNVNDTTRKFEYEWSRIRLANYTLLQMPHPLLDKYGYSNWAFVLDLKYVERRVFRHMTDDQLDLMKMGQSDSKEVRCMEISSILLKYPKCHALIIIEDDDEDEDAPSAPTTQPGEAA